MSNQIYSACNLLKSDLNKLCQLIVFIDELWRLFMLRSSQDLIELEFSFPSHNGKIMSGIVKTKKLNYIVRLCAPKKLFCFGQKECQICEKGPIVQVYQKGIAEFTVKTWCWVMLIFVNDVPVQKGEWRKKRWIQHKELYSQKALLKTEQLQI